MSTRGSGYELPPVWVELRADELVEWISTRTEDGSPPPIYNLAEPSSMQSLVREYAPAAIREWLHFQPDSGCAEFDFAGRPQTDLQGLQEFGLNLARRIDSRDFVRRFPVEPSTSDRPETVHDAELQSLEFGSVVDGIDVMGPGGRVLFHESGVRGVDVVVRRREGPVPSKWRQPQVVAKRTLGALTGAPAQLRLYASFGYYEASKYERQIVMRPAFGFLMEFAAGESTPGWRTILVEPATGSPHITTWAGLESWSDVEEEEEQT